MPANRKSAPRQRPAAISAGKQAAPADTTRSRPDLISIGPGTGLLPPIYIPPPGQPGPAGLLWHAQSGRYAGRCRARPGSQRPPPL